MSLILIKLNNTHRKNSINEHTYIKRKLTQPACQEGGGSQALRLWKKTEEHQSATHG